MKRKLSLCFILILYFKFPLAGASTQLSLEAAGSAETKSVFVDASGVAESWDWFAGFGRTSTRIENLNTGVLNTYITQDVFVGGGYNVQENLNLGLDLAAARTVESKYSESGAGMSLGWMYASLEIEPEELESFSPSGDLSIRLGRAEIKQVISFTILNRLVEREPTIEQSSVGLNWNHQPFERFRFGLRATGYSYNYSKAELQTTFNSSFLNYFSGDLVATVGGLPEFQGGLSLTFFASENLDLDFSSSQTRLIVDGSLTRSSEVTGSYQFEFVGVSLGMRFLTAQSFKENSLALGLNFIL